MKRFRLLYLTIISALMILVSCQGNDELYDVKGGGEPAVKEGYAQVRLHISPAGSSNGADARTRADWRDPIAKDEEMMNIWTVVIVNDATDAVQQIISCKPSGDYSEGKDDDREVDPIATLPLGTYRFYSFANIGGSELQTLLGLPSGSIPTPSDDNIVSNAIDDQPPTGGDAISDLGHVYKQGSNNNLNQASADIDINAAISGNKFAKLESTDNNGFGSYGIPMSNVQTATITGNTTLDLIVIRMLAKIELRFYNVTGKDINIKKITFSDVTKNPTGTDTNLKLLPNLTANNTMEYTHQDIKTNLNTSYTQRENVEFTYDSGLKVDKEFYVLTDPKLKTETGKYTTVSFYVNESAAPADNGLNGGLFNIELELENDDYRYALINSGENSGITIDASGNVTYGTKRDDDWTYIARNDYRIIPIVLDGYRLEMTPYDFPEIGVYPASVFVTNPSERISQQIYQMDFHDYGHFHLLPTVKRYYNDGTTDKTDEVGFSATSGGTGSYWTLYGAGTTAAAADWTNSFKSYTDAAGTSEYNLALNKGLASDADATGTADTYSKTSGFFYGSPGASGLPAANVYPTVYPAYGTAKDDSENGDWPVFYAPSGTDPYWVPVPISESGIKRPYIFGQIAPQEANADKKVFHEFKVNLYVNGSTVPRILTYRFYMHLKQDHAAARRRTARCH